MTNETMEYYKDLLLAERQEILEELAEESESARDLFENDMHNVNDFIDEASSKITQTILSTMNKNNQKRLISIEAALRRIAEGNFGVCVSCGNEIEDQRLEALPWTTQCINCKSTQNNK